MFKTYNIHLIWLSLVLLTLFTYVIGQLGYSSTLVVLVVLLTTLIKGSLIIRDYMELRGVSLLWRVIMYGWLWSVVLVITIIYIAAH